MPQVEADLEALCKLAKDLGATNAVSPVSYTHLTLPTNREV